MSIDLDPKEVLEHLQALGYTCITKDQLKQFIKDLKKLIKYDLRKFERSQQISSQENSSLDYGMRGLQGKDCGGISSETRQNGDRNVLAVKNQFENPCAEIRSKSIAVQTIIPPRNLFSNTSSEPDASLLKCCPCKAGSCCSSKTDKKPALEKRKNIPLKPVSSLIRTAPSEVRTGKADPVTLYHYYQNLWTRQNRPGENPHADIRWRIRHKMLAPATIKTNLEKKRENPPWID